MAHLPLADIKVVDLTRARAGPTCTRILGDWGADVIKVEARGSEKGDGFSGPRDGSDFQNLHRNKRSITLDLKQPASREVFNRLAAQADIVVENYRPDVKFRLGIDYETLKQLNPRLIYGSVSGFGQDGAYVNRPGVDQIAQGMGGLMSITGLPGQGPVRAGIAIADLAGGIFCAMGILIALHERVKSGAGQWVQSSLLASQISLLDFQATRWLIDHEKPGQAGNDHPTLVPTGVFKTSDGYINIAAGGQHMFERMCRAFGLEQMIGDPRFGSDQSRSDNRVALNAAIESYSSRHTSADILAALDRAEVPGGPIYTIDQVFDDPQVKHLGIAQRVTHGRLGPLDLLAPPMTLSRTPSQLRAASPECGEHTDDILSELGYNAAEIATLRSQKAV